MAGSWLRSAGLAALTFSAVACATPGPPPTVDGPGDRDVLAEGQLSDLERLSTFDAIRRLRPRWLSTRGQVALVGADREGVRVYLDGLLHGGAGSLKRLPVRNVGRISFLDGPRATLRFGTGHSSGAILVATRSGSAPGR